MGKILGIIGGLGPLATADFYKHIVDKTEAGCDQEHIETLIYSNCRIPKRVEYILGESDENPSPVLCETAKVLEKAGAEVLAMPCITAHFFYDDIKKSVGIEVINAIEVTSRLLRDRDISCVGILATKGTLRGGFLQKALSEFDISCVAPDDEYQEILDEIIFKKIKKGISVCPNDIKDIEENLTAQGAQRIIIACTDVSTIGLDKEFPNIYTDMMSLLEDECIRICKD
ncbi:MAG: amino acid racemase [Lachnospiraceae bacterium]|nr:amino acid racemase [Lachnospiraceae bacterium]